MAAESAKTIKPTASPTASLLRLSVTTAACTLDAGVVWNGNTAAFKERSTKPGGMNCSPRLALCGWLCFVTCLPDIQPASPMLRLGEARFC
jgi:hypothetical protein